MKIEIVYLCILFGLVACAPSHDGFSSSKPNSPSSNTPEATPPDNTTPSPGPAPNVEMLGWNSIDTRVIQSCTGCHGASYTSKAGVRRNISSISSAINNNRMPPRRPLAACPKALLKEWVRLGMPNDTTVAITSIAGCETANIQDVIDNWLLEQDVTFEAE